MNSISSAAFAPPPELFRERESVLQEQVGETGEVGGDGFINLLDLVGGIVAVCPDLMRPRNHVACEPAGGTESADARRELGFLADAGVEDLEGDIQRFPEHRSGSVEMPSPKGLDRLGKAPLDRLGEMGWHVGFSNAWVCFHDDEVLPAVFEAALPGHGWGACNGANRCADAFFASATDQQHGVIVTPVGHWPLGNRMGRHALGQTMRTRNLENGQ